ncbi:uncharacterized protein J4E87_003364 [Alternaria ethzedia]|uniref:uncharacterized protein n=1 Tax=Alternaria ethzedia TaxID=181014 RepID=UPI0020C3C614|nr:uncharacterized protein J4E87_003364 [Alternaria ethzedia]KAI4629103.1 hypothetical protein J4E87_003364 [Alternaria ethzedia]
MEANASSAAFLGEETEANITLRNQLESPLLRLPAELRNKIYAYVGVATTIQVVTRPQTHAKTWKDKKLLKYPQPNLLNTCKQVRQEATSLLYKHALFEFSRCGPLAVLFHHCEDNCCERMTSVRVGSRFLQFAVRKFVKKDDFWADTYKGTISVLPNVEIVRLVSSPDREWFEDNRVSAALRAWCGNNTPEVIFEDIYDGICWKSEWEDILGRTP